MRISSLMPGPFLADNASGTPASDPLSPEQTSKAISLQVSPEYTYCFYTFIGMALNAEYLCFQTAIRVLFDAPPIRKEFWCCSL